MTRRWTVALLLLLASATSAVARPTVAVLGLEVKGSGPIEQVSTAIARQLSEALRTAARRPAGPYALAPNSNKELIDEKLIKSCDDEAVGCMVQIGKGLEAAFLVYGKLENAAGHYTVTLHLLDIRQPSHPRTGSISVPHGATREQLGALAEQVYAELVGAVPDRGGAGTLVVKANAQRGRVMLDDEYQGKLERGTLELPGVGEGHWRVAVEAPGYQRQELTVEIKPDSTTTQVFELAELKIQQEPTNVARPVFYVTAASAVGLGVFSLVAYVRWSGEFSDQVKTQTHTNDGDRAVGPQDCNGSRARFVDDGGIAALERLCSWRDYNTYSAVAAGALGVIAVVSGLFAFHEGSPPTKAAASRGTHPTRQYSFTPMFAPHAAAASFQLRW